MGDTNWSEMRPLLVAELKALRRLGVHRLAEVEEKYPVILDVAGHVLGERSSAGCEEVLRRARHQMGASPAGETVGFLYGLDPGLRGRTPTALRTLAASRMGYDVVETFRKKPEREAIEAFADAVYSLVVQQRLLERGAGGSLERVEQIVKAIENLTTLELAELARQLKTTLFVP